MWGRLRLFGKAKGCFKQMLLVPEKAPKFALRKCLVPGASYCSAVMQSRVASWMHAAV